MALLVCLLGAACSRSTKPAGESSAGTPSESSPPTESSAAETLAAHLPKQGGPPGYVSSDACRSCHEDQYSSWHRSYHRTMTQLPGPEAVQANFKNVILTNETTRYTLLDSDGFYRVRMESLAQNAQEAAPRAAEVPIGLVTGSHNMQVFWLPEGHGNLQVGFPFTWLIPEKRWVPRNSTFVRPPDTVHHAEAWNIVCSRCHTTGVEPHADMPARRIETRVGEFGIACEACHGPGERHVAAQKVRAQAAAAGQKPNPDQPAVAPGEIVHPKKLTAERAGQVCGFCHSMKWIDRSENWRENGFRFRPGDDLEETTPIIRPSRVNDIPGLADYLARHPDVLEDFFWPDGMIRVSGRDYNGLIESPCYKGGKFSCLSCHSLHESEPASQLAEKGKSNTACTQCHEPYREAARLEAHTHHRAGSSGSDCYNCHMPHTAYGVLKAIRSHQISSPSVPVDIATGRPNACNLCHLDKTLDWTASYLNQWFGQPKPELPPAGTNISHVVRLALAGDAGQRVLAAWHLGWEPALQTSDKNRVIPILAQLLDDPYAAVRCAAERSLRKIPDAMPAGYDFAIEPGAREPVRDRVWAAWKSRGATSPAREHPRLVTGDLNLQRQRFDAWLAQRNNRPVRLRE